MRQFHYPFCHFFELQSKATCEFVCVCLFLWSTIAWTDFGPVCFWPVKKCYLTLTSKYILVDSWSQLHPILFLTYIWSIVCLQIFIFPSLFKRNFLLTQPQVFNCTFISTCITHNFSLQFSFPALEPITFVLTFLGNAPIYCRFTLGVFLPGFKTSFLCFSFFLCFAIKSHARMSG